MIREPFPPAPAAQPRVSRSAPRALRLALAAGVVVAVSTVQSPVAAGNRPLHARLPAAVTSSDTVTAADSAVVDTLRALDRLHRYGYTVTTPARAVRAIRHWQQANGLTVNGAVTPEVLSSLSLTPESSTTATAPAVRDNLPPEQSVDQIIRGAWPDELEQHAVDIAWRESRWQPAARNACCYGLFQINWSAHRGWLAGMGVTSASQLLDPATNAAAAFALYQRDGWRPWTL